jgi:hypothetical protein
LETLAFELHAQGAIEPISWAMSEITENIAQRARYYALREFNLLTENIPANLASSCDFNEDPENIFNDICEAIGKKETEEFLMAYGKGMISIALNIIDYGYSPGATVGWSLTETDADGVPTGRLVSGLHEDWLEFEEQTSTRPLA